jgi:hypothetical protein
MTLVTPRCSDTLAELWRTERSRTPRWFEAEKEQIRTGYQQALQDSVAFEKRIRDRSREKNRQKNERIAELEAKVEELERRLAKS